MQKSETNIRLSNIELLRIFAMAGVIFLHYFNANVGGAIKLVNRGTINYHILMALEMLSICAVDLFVMISGYFLSEKKERSIGHALALIMQVIIYRAMYYFLRLALNGGQVSFETIVIMLLPVNWFVSLYVAMYIISPLINLALERVNKKKTVIIVLALFSVWPTAVDVLQRTMDTDLNAISSLGINGSERGYTITNFLMCYVVGAALNNPNLKSVSKVQLMLFLFLDYLLMNAWNYRDANTGREYCNPLIVAFAAGLLTLFLRMDIGRNKLINRIASSSFSVYIVHLWLLPLFKIKEYVSRNPCIMLVHIAFTVLLIILIALIIDYLYKFVFGRINNSLKGLWRFSYSDQ